MFYILSHFLFKPDVSAWTYLPDKLVSQVVNKVIYLIPVMLHTARPEKRFQGRPIYYFDVSMEM